MKPMTIGRLSKAAGVKVTTIRYYESIGLMGTPDRSESGQRQYGDDAVQRLSFIRHARDLGFPMEAIRDLIDLQTEPTMTAPPSTQSPGISWPMCASGSASLKRSKLNSNA